MTCRLVLLAAMAGAAVAYAPLRAAQGPVFRAGVDLVNVTVSVRQHGQPVAGLNAADFEVRDDGVVQSILDVSRDTLGLDITLVLDTSGSVQGPLLDSLIRAVNDISRTLGPLDRVRLVTFNHRLRQVQDLAPELPLLSASRFGPTTGGTSLFDAMVATLITPAVPDRRQMAIVFTDGDDTTSFLDESTVVDVASRSDTTVFAVTVADAGVALPARTPSQRMFQRVTEATGGALAVLRRDEDLGASFVRAFDDFRTSYVLRVTANPGVAERPDGWHALSVTMKRPGSFDVRARPGYFAPGAPSS